MILELKEDNPFYGKKGTLFNKHILRLIPSKHHSLFQEQVRESNRSASIYDVENYIRNAIMNLDQAPVVAAAPADVPNQPLEWGDQWGDEEEPEEDDFDDDDDHDAYWDYQPGEYEDDNEDNTF